jgi:hypothetical protein
MKFFIIIFQFTPGRKRAEVLHAELRRGETLPRVFVRLLWGHIVTGFGLLTLFAIVALLKRP